MPSRVMERMSTEKVRTSPRRARNIPIEVRTIKTHAAAMYCAIGVSLCLLRREECSTRRRKKRDCMRAAVIPKKSTLSTTRDHMSEERDKCRNAHTA